MHVLLKYKFVFISRGNQIQIGNSKIRQFIDSLAGIESTPVES